MYEDLMQKINENCHNIDKDMVKRAYDLACDAHKEQ